MTVETAPAKNQHMPESVRRFREVFNRLLNPEYEPTTLEEHARDLAVLVTILSDNVETVFGVHDLNYQEIWDGLMEDLKNAMEGIPETDQIGLERAILKRLKRLIKKGANKKRPTVHDASKDAAAVVDTPLKDAI